MCGRWSGGVGEGGREGGGAGEREREEGEGGEVVVVAVVLSHLSIVAMRDSHSATLR